MTVRIPTLPLLTFIIYKHKVFVTFYAFAGRVAPLTVGYGALGPAFTLLVGAVGVVAFGAAALVVALVAVLGADRRAGACAGDPHPLFACGTLAIRTTLLTVVNIAF